MEEYKITNYKLSRISGIPLSGQITNTVKEIAKPASLARYDIAFLANDKFGGWHMEEDTCRFIGRVCEELKPETVLEFGSGISTLVLAREAEKGNVGKIYSVDHLKDFSGHPRAVIASGNTKVKFCHFPIRLRFYGGKLFQFYSLPSDFLKNMKPIDLVIIDGPPYYYNSREAAMYVVYPYLSPTGLLILDDAKRVNRERIYMENWKHYFGDNIEILFLEGFKKGLGCIWLGAHRYQTASFTPFERIRDSFAALKQECLIRLKNMIRTQNSKVKTTCPPQAGEQNFPASPGSSYLGGIPQRREKLICHTDLNI